MTTEETTRATTDEGSEAHATTTTEAARRAAEGPHASSPLVRDSPPPARAERDYPQGHVAAGLLGLIGCGFVAVSILSSEGVSLVTAVLGLGLGLVAAISRGRPEGVVSISVDEASGAVMLHLRDRSTVSLPHATVERITLEERGTFDAKDRRTSHVRWIVVVHKRDGGRLEALTFQATGQDAARALVDDLQRDLDAVRARDDVAPDPDAIVAQARAIPGVTVLVEGGGGSTYRTSAKSGPLVLSWKTPIVFSSLFIALSCTLGMAHVLRAFAASQPAVMFGYWFMIGLAAFVVLTTVTVGGATIVRIDDAALVVEQRRFGKTRGRRSFVLADVAAIDYTRRASAGQLVVRLVGDVPEGETRDPLVLVRQLVGRAIPTGAMTVTDCVALDLVLSAEIARRKGVAPGSV